MVSKSDVMMGWKERRHEGGTLMNIQSDTIVTDKLSMPHSPRVHNGQLYILESGRGYLVRVDEQTGAKEDVAFCPGFLRGLAIAKGHAIITSSLPRDGTFKGLELDNNIKEKDGEAWCGVFIINLKTGDVVEWIKFEGEIKELFDVTVLRNVSCPMAYGINSPEVLNTVTYDETYAPIDLMSSSS
jgi:uncharacterized protein (TIGR03032 family)